jgi:site-specific DNA-methyltransferase (adenine-specific)
MAYNYLNVDCFEWMQTYPQNSITAIVTDPPYGVKEYTDIEIDKKRNGGGGVWRIPPAFDGHKRQPLPRFSVINDSTDERENVYSFFHNWATLAIRLLVPGGHVFIASTPLLSDILGRAMRDAGFERRGEIIRTVVTFRGGDRPKGAEEEFRDVSVIPRGVWEPWGLYRKPISEKTVAENLRKWKAGALRRKNDGTPFCDLIESTKTPRIEREIAPHPSIKPQLFLREIVSAALPLSSGVLLDPFAGSGSTLSAAEYLGLDSIGTEKDNEFYNIGKTAIPKLATLYSESERVVSSLGQATLFEGNTYFGLDATLLAQNQDSNILTHL